MKCFLLFVLSVMLLSCSKRDEDIKPNQPPQAFNLVAVANHATGVVLKPTLSWQTATDPNGDAVTYSLYLDKNAQPTTLVKNGLATTAFTLTTALTHNAIYYWKVIATDAKGATTASSVFKFTTESAANPNQPPKAFTLTAPANNAVNVTLKPALSWQATTDPNGDAVTYSIYLDKNTNPATLLKSGLTTAGFTLTTALANNTAYYWKVVATDTKGAKTESNVFKFTTLATAPATVSLPVKTIYKNASGTVISTNTITYDTQKRISKLVIVSQNPNRSAVHTFNYENGKIIQLIDWEDAAKPLEKYIYFYNANGMLKEELYWNNVLAYNYEWFYRPDGGKERRVKNPDAGNSVVQTWYYKFSATGNIERVVIDNVSGEDFEYTYSNYDTKLHSISSPVSSIMPYILLGFPGTNLPAPNNPQAYTRKSLTTGNMIASQTLEHTYNNKNQVTLMKLKDSDNGALIEIRIIEYQEF